MAIFIGSIFCRQIQYVLLTYTYGRIDYGGRVPRSRHRGAEFGRMEWQNVNYLKNTFFFTFNNSNNKEDSHNKTMSMPAYYTFAGISAGDKSKAFDFIYYRHTHTHNLNHPHSGEELIETPRTAPVMRVSRYCRIRWQYRKNFCTAGGLYLICRKGFATDKKLRRIRTKIFHSNWTPSLVMMHAERETDAAWCGRGKGEERHSGSD